MFQITCKGVDMSMVPAEEPEVIKESNINYF